MLDAKILYIIIESYIINKFVDFYNNYLKKYFNDSFL